MKGLQIGTVAYLEEDGFVSRVEIVENNCRKGVEDYRLRIIKNLKSSLVHAAPEPKPGIIITCYQSEDRRFFRLTTDLTEASDLNVDQPNQPTQTPTQKGPKKGWRRWIPGLR